MSLVVNFSSREIISSLRAESKPEIIDRTTLKIQTSKEAVVMDHRQKMVIMWRCLRAPPFGKMAEKLFIFLLVKMLITHLTARH